MGSVALAGEDKSQPSTSNGMNCKLSTTFVDGCGGVNHALVPRKQRSAVKRRGRESLISPLLIQGQKHHAKKSKLIMKQGDISKDEEEVAETLYALAGLFSDAKKAEPEPRSSGSSVNTPQDNCPITIQQETRKMSSNITLKAILLSNLVNSTADQDEARPEFLSSKQAVRPYAYANQSDIITSRPVVSILGMNQSGGQKIHLDGITASRSRYGSSISDKCKDLFLSPNFSAGGYTTSETQKPCPSGRIPYLLESTTFSSKNRITTEMCTRAAPKTNKSWKRCSGHIYISRLIKVLLISDRKEVSLQPTQLTTCGGTDQQSNVRIHSRGNVRNGNEHFSACNLLAAQKDSSAIQDQQMACETSASKQGYDFLSLGTELRRSGNGTGYFNEPPKQFHRPYTQSQNQSHMLCSLPQNGYSSSFHGHNSAQQLSQYHSSNFTAEMMESHQQKCARYNMGGSDWRNGGINSGSMLNYAHSIFTHLHALGSNYQQLSPSQQQVLAINSSVKRHHHNISIGFDSDGIVSHPENTAELQLQRTGNQRL